MTKLLDALAGVLNAREPLPGLVSGGQPNLDHLAALKAAECAVVVDMRDPMEPQPIDAPRDVRAAGLEYINIAVPHVVPADGTFQSVRETLGRTLDKGRSVFAYCNSGNRVGAALIPYFVLDRGLSEEEAVLRAMQMGTRSAELIDGAIAYVRRARGASSG